MFLLLQLIRRGCYLMNTYYNVYVEISTSNFREFSKEREKARARGLFQKFREKQQLEEDLKVSCTKFFAE